MDVGYHAPQYTPEPYSAPEAIVLSFECLSLGFMAWG